MDGILLVDKPKGWTSFDVVAKVRGIIKTELRKTNPAIKNVKVGHTGTLDPSATGLLVLCVGKYTKKVPDMIRHDKTYEVEMTLGASSTTGDQEGEITKGELPDISKDMLEMVLRSLLGEQMQIPPAFSAIKVNGQRAYDLARQGKEVKLEPRKCTIYSIELKSYDGSKAVFTTSVSSGTYIRSLVEDIGSKLGTHAYMSELRRTHVDRFSVQSALSSDELTIENIKERLLMDKYKPTIQKTSAIVLVVSGDTLLMQEMTHQGGVIYDIFGSFVADGQDAMAIVRKLADEKIGSNYAIRYFGEILERIEKPEEHVDLRGLVFRIDVTDEQKMAYKLKDGQFWADRAFIESNIGIREGDRRLYVRALEDRPFNVELSETQLGKWIDAKLLSWNDR